MDIFTEIVIVSFQFCFSVVQGERPLIHVSYSAIIPRLILVNVNSLSTK